MLWKFIVFPIKLWNVWIYLLLLLCIRVFELQFEEEEPTKKYPIEINHDIEFCVLSIRCYLYK